MAMPVERRGPALHGGQDFGVDLFGGVFRDGVQVVRRKVAPDRARAAGARRGGRGAASAGILKDAGELGGEDGGGGREES